MKTIKYILSTIVLVAGAITVHAQNADEIIQKHIDAIGGYDKWANINSMKMVGSMNVQGMDISMTQTTVNNKGTRTDISVMGTNGYTIVTPTEGWIYMPIQPGMDKVTPLPPDQVKASQDKINIRNMQLVDKSLIAKSEFIGKDTINTIGCYKVKITDKAGNTQTAFFDAAKYYLVRIENKVKIQDEEQEIGINFSDFKQLPEGVTMAMTWGSPQGDITFKSVEINKPYDDNIFKPTAPNMKN